MFQLKEKGWNILKARLECKMCQVDQLLILGMGHPHPKHQRKSSEWVSANVVDRPQHICYNNFSIFKIRTPQKSTSATSWQMAWDYEPLQYTGLQIWPSIKAKPWKPTCRSLSMICGFVCLKMSRGQICNLDIVRPQGGMALRDCTLCFP